MPKYPIEVELVGTDGNAFALIGKVKKAIQKEYGAEEASAFTAEAFQQESYDHLLAFLMETVEVG